MKTLNIAKNYRNNARLWIEQSALNTICGFNKGDKVTIRFTDKCIYILKDAEGSKSVSGRTRNGKFIPIFEITNKALTAWCAANNCYRVDVNFTSGVVGVSPTLEQSK